MRSTLGDGVACARSVPGTRLEVDLHDRVQRQMWAGCYEPHVRKCLETLLAEGDVFVDVGAHIGYLTVAAAQKVGAKGRVYAFEPDPVLYDRLARNARQLRWVETIHSAVWKESGTLTFERSASAGESGWGTLTSVRDLRMGEHLSVPVTSLDDWAARSEVDRIQALKIDAEGSEAGILDGAGQLIARFRPIVIMEINDPLLRQAGASALALACHAVLAAYSTYGLYWMQLQPLAGREATNEFPPEVLCLPNVRTDMTLGRLQKVGFKLC